MMLQSSPSWTFTSKYQLTQWYGHVQLLPDYALGQWFCTHRKPGSLQWERTISPANAVMGVTEGVIIASQTVSRGPGTWHEGCFGIALESGDLLWELPTEAPSVVEDSECICSSGRVIAARDGRLLRHVSREAVRSAELRYWDAVSDAKKLYRTHTGGPHPKRASVAGVGWLTHLKSPGPSMRDDFRLYAISAHDEVLWVFNLADTGYFIRHCNYYAYRLAGKHLYIVASERALPTQFHLLTLELSRGTVVQDFLLDNGPVEECRIEDVDARALLLSFDNRVLWHFPRVSS